MEARLLAGGEEAVRMKWRGGQEGGGGFGLGLEALVQTHGSWWCTSVMYEHTHVHSVGI
jgi:hypothetical protein